MTDKELLKLALDALEHHQQQTRPIHKTGEAIADLRAALALPEAEPVAWVRNDDGALFFVGAP